jgi:hypothetical protein
MDIEKSLAILAELKDRGIIKAYAIGGAVACIAYIEPFLTYDLDVFVSLPATGAKIVDIVPIYDYLRRKGYQCQKEHVMIEGVPVQFIPPYNSLIEEAIDEAVEIAYKNGTMTVCRIEHLLAIMIQTDRPKDRVRITQVLEGARLDHAYLMDIVKRHGLMERWGQFKGRFYAD